MSSEGDAPPAGTGWAHTGLAQRLVFGPGTVREVPELLRALGLRRVMLVTTAGRLASADGRRLTGLLGASLASTFAEVASHAPAPVVQAAVLQARRDGVDGLVSFGGGSCADTAKAVNFFAEQEAGMPATTWTDRPMLPHVAVPTTYSGAELTPFFGMTDPHTRQKRGAGGPSCAPVAAVYDPELTVATPPRVSAETGMNALAHCVEVVWSPSRTPEAEAIALAGARRIVGALPAVVERPGELAARSTMLEGAALGGRCLQNGTMGIHHGLSQLIGGRTGIPHGLANAVILPHAIRYNAGAVPEAIAALSDAMGASDDLAAFVASFVARLGLPTRLSECGVHEEDLEAVARLSPSNPNVLLNPRPVSEADALAVLRAAF
ncbi:iron-containing alcohol dehydrogenase family protein [Rhabdothermincola sp.]|uniref:iron-containing alcohol dehydrogenase family protein n=1 Tax=Rhabdothermincola sp. TaxID=2820405 RepID=UPI002FE2DF78